MKIPLQFTILSQISRKTIATLAIFSISGSCSACVRPRVFILRGALKADM